MTETNEIQRAKEYYQSLKEVKCPYFGEPVVLNSDGFNHLLHKRNREPRTVNEQLLKVRLLKKAIQVLSKSGTVQEFRRTTEKTGNPSNDGFFKTSTVEYWGFQAIVGTERLIKIKVIVRRIGNGKHHFWSVMPHHKLNKQKLFSEGIEEG